MSPLVRAARGSWAHRGFLLRWVPRAAAGRAPRPSSDSLGQVGGSAFGEGRGSSRLDGQVGDLHSAARGRWGGGRRLARTALHLPPCLSDASAIELPIQICVPLVRGAGDRGARAMQVHFFCRAPDPSHGSSDSNSSANEGGGISERGLQV
jgi:hypothetical protein